MTSRQKWMKRIMNETRVNSMIKAICLDTRLLSRFLAKKKAAVELVGKWKEDQYEIYTTAINVSEMMMGLWKIGPISEKRIEELKNFFLDLHVRQLDLDAAMQTGRIFTDLSRGKEIGWRDTFIAAIVMNNGKKIITSNPAHFNKIPDLDVIECE